MGSGRLCCRALVLVTVFSTASLTFFPAAAAPRSSALEERLGANPQLVSWGYGPAGWSSISRTRPARWSRWAGVGGGLQCVPFARAASGIGLVGNAWTWWDQAAGRYQRGTAPEPGSVLAFRANRFMRLGHVAVVSRVINPREILVDHANWRYRGSITRGVSVVDVSPNNDWTAVRVEMGRPGEFGSIYPTSGFIYTRPDRGNLVTANTVPVPPPVLNPAPADLRPAIEQAGAPAFEEVAEVPAPRRRGNR